MNSSTMPFSKLRLTGPQNIQNPRTKTGLDETSIRELGIHIGLHGLINALVVTPDGLVVGGQRRYRAIEFLMQWFSAHPPKPRPQLEDHPRFHEMFGDLTHADVSMIERRVREYEEQVPVRVLGPTATGIDGVALADNLQRSDLSSFEIAAHLDHLQRGGATQADLVRLIGKSKTYVSRKLSTFRGACDELREAWASDQLTEEQVQDLAKLPHDQQRKKLGEPIARGRRGPANRPGIDTVKEILGELEKLEISETPQMNVGHERYTSGVRDALRWVNGDKTSSEFASVMEAANAGVSS